MRIFKIAFLTLLMTCLAAGTVMAKSDKDHDKGAANGKGHEKEQQGQIAKAAAQENKTLKAQDAAKQKIEEQVRAYRVADRGAALRGDVSRTPVSSMKSAEKALAKLESARWAYNPNDTRGQGNMGKVTMIAPYGHDKDSDRLEVYGNRGRVVRETPEPPPVEPPVVNPPAEPTPVEEPPVIPPPAQPPLPESPPVVEPPLDWPPF